MFEREREREREGLVLCMFGGIWLYRLVGVFCVSGERSGCKSIYKWKSNELEISAKFFLVEISTKNRSTCFIFLGCIFGLYD